VIGEPRIRVAGLLVNGGRVLLVRHEKDERSYWLLPGGGVDAGEQLEDAVRREFAEECAIVPSAVRGPVAMAETIPPPHLAHGRHILHMIFAIEAEAGAAEALRSSDDAVIGHAFVDQRRLRDLDLRPPIHDFLAAYRPGDAFVSLGRMWTS
jgi:ADP-ribose pyrophosphatase YjhB (NUDIX family)